MSDDDLQARIHAWLGPVLKRELSPWDEVYVDDETPAAGTAPRPPADDPSETSAAAHVGAEGQDDLSDEELAAWEAESEQTEEQEAATIQRLRELRKQYRARLSVPEHHREQARLYTKATADEIRPVPGTVWHQTVEALLAVGRKNGALDPSRSCVYASAYARALEAMKPTSSDQEGDAE